MTFRYRLVDFCLQSPFSLPFQTIESHSKLPKVQIQWQIEPHQKGQLAHTQYNSKSTSIFWPKLGTVRVTDGANITVEALPSASWEDWAFNLSGCILAILCEQRGWIPLHGGSLSWSSESFALLGPSGIGKSTFMKTCLNRGAKILSDDLVLINNNSSQEAQCHPVYEGYKSFDTTPAEDYRAAYPHIDGEKNIFIPTIQNNVSPQKLQNLIFLESASEFKIEKLEYHQAYPRILQHTHTASYLSPHARIEHLRQCSEWMPNINFYYVHYPQNWEALEKLISYFSPITKR